MVQQQYPRLDEQTIADTVATVFSAPEFNQRPSVLSRLWWWRQYLPDWLLDDDNQDRILIGLAIGIAIALVSRWGYEEWLMRRIPGSAVFRRASAASRDQWSLAQELAGRGDFTGAAHALYLALLELLARRDQVRIHPAKTVGDYLRELRTRAPGSLAPVREFARSYEVVAYGDRACDAERYGRLRSLVAGVMESRG